MTEQSLKLLFSYIKEISTLRVKILLFSAPINNISVIMWRSVLLMKETGEPREHH